MASWDADRLFRVRIPRFLSGLTMYLKMQKIITRDTAENGQSWKVSLARFCRPYAKSPRLLRSQEKNPPALHALRCPTVLQTVGDLRAGTCPYSGAAEGDRGRKAHTEKGSEAGYSIRGDRKRNDLL